MHPGGRSGAGSGGMITKIGVVVLAAVGLVAISGFVMQLSAVGDGGVGGSAHTTVLQRQLEDRLAGLDAEIERRVSAAMANQVMSQAASVSPQADRTGAGKVFPPVTKLPQDKVKRVLVTGGAGFVGSNLVDVLMRQGHIVYVLDNLFTGRKQNIAHWLGHPNFEFFQHDVIEPFMVEVDEIYHLACPASPPHYQYNPIKTVKTSTMGTLNMLGLAKRTRARMLFTSTSEVYGDPEEHPQKETYWGHVNIIGPRSCYDEGKRVAETMCHVYRTEGHVDVRVARIFNTFGPRMHPNDGRVVSNFIIQALKGQDLTVYGDGMQTRSFQFVSDLVDGLMRLMASNYTGPVNIGNPDEFTIKDFAQVIIDEIGNPALKVTHRPAVTDDPQQRKPAIGVAQRELGWSPKVAVPEGLKQTIKYFQQELRTAPSPDDTVIWI